MFCFTLIRFLAGLCKTETLNEKIIGFKKSERDCLREKDIVFVSGEWF